jgi:hypothetical protein
MEMKRYRKYYRKGLVHGALLTMLVGLVIKLIFLWAA